MIIKSQTTLLCIKLHSYIIIFRVQKSKMQCPRCKSRTLILQKSKRVCKVPECFYQDQHPISYDNDVRHYQGQRNGQNRFSTLYNASLDHGGVSLDKEANYDKQLKKGQKHIRDICLLLKLSQKIESTAEARFFTIFQIRFKEKLQKDQKLQKTQKKNDKDDDNSKNQVSSKALTVKQIACYSVYSACFQNQNFFQENNLTKWMKISKRSWQHLVKNLNGQLKNKIDFIPVQKPLHFILRVCRKRRIDTPQQRAMIKLCQKIAQKGIQDGCPRKTVAACAFWKICQHSIKYRSQFKLNDICKKTAELKQSIPNEADKYFDIAPDTIKKFFSDKMEKQFYQEYLPDWPGRINIDSFIK